MSDEAKLVHYGVRTLLILGAGVDIMGIFSGQLWFKAFLWFLIGWYVNDLVHKRHFRVS